MLNFEYTLLFNLYGTLVNLTHFTSQRLASLGRMNIKTLIQKSSPKSNISVGGSGRE